MFYLIAGLLLTLYYLVWVPKTVKGTMNTVLLVGSLGIFAVLGILGFVKVLQSPPEFFIGFLMSLLGVYVIKDLLGLTPRPKGAMKVKVSQDKPKG